MPRISEDSSGAGKNYLRVAYGNFVQRVNNPTETSKERALEMGPNTGKKVHEEHFPAIIGYLTGIIYDEDNEFGDRWLLTLSDEQETNQIELPMKGATVFGLLSALPNVDVSKQVKLRATSFERDNSDRPMNWVFVNQQDESGEWHGVERAWTKDNPGKMPDLEKTKFNGKEVWDSGKRIEFFKREMAKVQKSIEKLGFKVEPVASSGEDDGLPF